ncbi:MAG: 3-hydroxyacyl-CoA dehydrogenase NAD-binding domain-containing protein [Alphaproteobacteria bacterium]|jgi:carnitine 3-dehydrogenase|nr:3-hydroxyacyl-CoA dehydrogenase NAD-binding domain-containing protein [Alphaproteobacteria bacterium]
MTNAPTSRPAPDAVGRVACIGCGVIGAGWAAHFLSRGYDVVAWDPAPDAGAKLGELIAAARPALADLGLPLDAASSRLTFAPSLAAACAEVDFVQESAPERLELKVTLLSEIDRATPADVVIASSTSGFLMTELQTGAANPERLVVGHPFNPPYLMPLVEVVGGDATDCAAVDWAAAFYEAAGKIVLRMRREVPGFIADRLQQALWHEALHMIEAGEATAAEIDRSIAAGPGLRWAIMGHCLTYHLAGGEGGMAQFLDHFDPEVAAPWTRLASPELTPALRQALVASCESASGARSIAELVQHRDRCLVAVMRALEAARGGEGGIV